MVLLACQGAIHDPVVLDFCFTVVPLEVKAGCCAGTHPQVLGGVDLCKESDITSVTWGHAHFSCILDSARFCGDSPHHLTLGLTCERPQGCPSAFGLPGWPRQTRGPFGEFDLGVIYQHALRMSLVRSEVPGVF